jgi:hypothetical protein
MLTKEHAEAIAAKFKAKIKPGSAHDVAIVEHNGKRVAQFGIRRGSNKDQGHDHIPTNLHMSPRDTMELARCGITVDEWITRMRQKGLITAQS